MKPARAQVAAKSQRGAIVVIAAMAISVLVIMLSLIDIGFLYLYKRDYQKAADLAALSGARKLHEGCAAAEVVSQNIARNNLAGQRFNAPASVACGRWHKDTPRQVSAPSGGKLSNAVQVEISGAPPQFLMPLLSGRQPAVISARAVAISHDPAAALQIRNTLVSLDTEQSRLLNLLVGGLLGSHIELSVAGWNGLLNTNITLLQYLDALPALLNLGISAGDYERLLNVPISIVDLIEVTIDLVGQDSVVGVALGQFVSIALLRDVDIRLGELLGISLATPENALGVDVNLFNLVQALVQIANNDHAIAAEVPIDIPGVVTLGVKLSVIEAPQFSAVGNPATDHIAVRTAQVRALVSADLEVLGIVNELLGIITGEWLGMLTGVVNDLLGLRLVSVVQGLFEGLLGCGNFAQPACSETHAIHVSVVPDQRLDISVDVGAAYARVSGYDCSEASGMDKALDVTATTAVGNLRIGMIPDAFATDPIVEPVELLQVGEQTVRPEQCVPMSLLLGAIGCSGLQYKRADGSWTGNRDQAEFRVKMGIRLRANNSPLLGGSNQYLTYEAPPDHELPEVSQPLGADEDLYYQSIVPNDLIGSLRSTLQAIDLDVYRTDSSGGVLEVLTGILNAALEVVIDGLLVPLVTVLGLILDPILNLLLNLLGVNLAGAEVAAELSCNNDVSVLVQ